MFHQPLLFVLFIMVNSNLAFDESKYYNYPGLQSGNQPFYRFGNFEQNGLWNEKLITKRLDEMNDTLTEKSGEFKA